MMYWPSADHAGIETRTLLSVNTARGFEPSAFMTQRLFCPRRSETNAISFPSGEIRGWVLMAIPLDWVSATASPPAAGSR